MNFLAKISNSLNLTRCITKYITLHVYPNNEQRYACNLFSTL